MPLHPALGVVGLEQAAQYAIAGDVKGVVGGENQNAEAPLLPHDFVTHRRLQNRVQASFRRIDVRGDKSLFQNFLELFNLICELKTVFVN